MTLVERSKLVAEGTADLLISIHHDSAQDKYLKTRTVEGKDQRYTVDDRFSGYSIFVSRKNPRSEESLQAAQGIGRAMAAMGYRFATHHAEKIQGESRAIIDPLTGVYAFDDLIVLKSATMPAVLVECGVILNPKEEELLRTPDLREKIARAIVKGITDYFAPVQSTPSDFAKLPIEESQPAVDLKPVAPHSPTPAPKSDHSEGERK